jgi:hypothetical protein
MINRGISGVRNQSKLTTIFEATINIYNVQKGNTIDTLKKFLSHFKNEMYTEKGASCSEFKVHLYKWERAQDVFQFIMGVPNVFNNCQLIHHRKQTSNKGDLGSSDEEGLSAASSKNKKRRVVASGEDDDFFVVQR